MILKANLRNESEEYVMKVLQINSYERNCLDENPARFLKEVASFLNSSDNCITEAIKTLGLYHYIRKIENLILETTDQIVF